METHSAAGAPRYRCEFVVRYELINQPIPDRDFIVDLPPRTRVQDAREPGRAINFRLVENRSSTNVAGASSAAVPFFDRWRNAIIVGMVIGIIISIGFVVSARRQRHRDQISASTTGASRRSNAGDVAVGARSCR